MIYVGLALEKLGDKKTVDGKIIVPVEMAFSDKAMRHLLDEIWKKYQQ